MLVGYEFTIELIYIILDYVCLGSSHLCWLFCSHSFLGHCISNWSSSSVPGCLQRQDLSRPSLLCQRVWCQQRSSPRLLPSLCYQCHLHSHRKPEPGKALSSKSSIMFNSEPKWEIIYFLLLGFHFAFKFFHRRLCVDQLFSFPCQYNEVRAFYKFNFPHIFIIHNELCIKQKSCLLAPVLYIIQYKNENTILQRGYFVLACVKQSNTRLMSF